ERSKLDSDAIGKKARTINFSTFEFQSKFRSVKTSFSFSAGKASENLPALDLQPRLEGGGVSYRSHDIDASSDFEFKRTNEASSILLGRLGVTPENVRIPDLSSLDFKSVGGRNSNINYRRAYRLPTQTQDAGVMMRHFLPIGVCAAFDAIEVEVDSFFELLVDQNARY
ncbi:MAG: hypothetical protein NTY70_16180, partial [Burkholderiales bacterium]|nr:hypothetical protein [Burkholderiales bacterium]